MRYWKRTNYSLRFSILAIIILFFLLCTISVIFIRSISFEHSINYTGQRLLTSASKVVQYHLTSNLNRAQVASEFSAKLIENNLLHDDIPALTIYTEQLLKTLPLSKGIFYGDEEGNYIYTEKQPDHTIKIDVFNRRVDPPIRTTNYFDTQRALIKHMSTTDLNYDPRYRPWYRDAKQAQKTIWTNIFKLAQQSQLAIATAAPVIKNNRFVGAFGIDVTLDNLIIFVEHQNISPNGFSFVINENEDLIAYPNKGIFKNLKKGNGKLINVHNNTQLALVDKAIDYYKTQDKSYFTLKFADQIYLVKFAQASIGSKPKPWLIGVIVPRNDFTGHLQHENLMTILVSGLLLLIAIVLISHIISKVVKPINLLAEETEKIKHFELDHTINIDSKITEVNRLAYAINSMKLGLKQFQKYVPKVLVQQLVETEQEMHVGGERKKLVIFFSDIRAFTSIAEETRASLLTVQLCEYFEALSDIITKEHGTIDKYIGDSVMAFWGAPLPELAPATHAARAAINCIKKINELNAKWLNEGKRPFETRIGLHLGSAIVGNIGSTERLSYTAIGDTINTAQRLENVNKIYKTKIMVSHPVYLRLKSNFIFRFIDIVKVPGRTETITIYELLGELSDTIPFDIETYNKTYAKAFKAFQKKDYEVAMRLFRKCTEIYPEDTVAPVFIHKCKR